MKLAVSGIKKSCKAGFFLPENGINHIFPDFDIWVAQAGLKL
jgi:hypothetical protein